MQIVTLAKLLLRYGLGARHLDAVVDDMLARFVRIYDIQDQGTAFASIGSCWPRPSHLK